MNFQQNHQCFPMRNPTMCSMSLINRSAPGNIRKSVNFFRREKVIQNLQCK